MSDVRVRINGEEACLPPLSIKQLLDHYGLSGRMVALERNRAIVNRSQYEQVHIADGDVIEIVHCVSGG